MRKKVVQLSLFEDLSTATPVTLKALRFAFKQQKMLERRAIRVYLKSCLKAVKR